MFTGIIFATLSLAPTVLAAATPQQNGPDPDFSPADVRTFGRFSAQIPHDGITLTYSVNHRAKTVDLRWGYEHSGVFHATTVSEPVSYTPTAITQLDAHRLAVAGRKKNGRVIIEEWSLRYSDEVPQPTTDSSGNLVLGDYTGTVGGRILRYDEPASGRKEHIAAMFLLRSADPQHNVVLLKDAVSHDIASIDLATGTRTELYDGNGVGSTPKVPSVPLLSTGWTHCAAYRDSVHGMVYGFTVDLNEYSNPPARAVYFIDQEEDGSIDSTSVVYDTPGLQSFWGPDPDIGRLQLQ